jgi:hypothetical protein
MIAGAQYLQGYYSAQSFGAGWSVSLQSPFQMNRVCRTIVNEPS